MHGSAERDGRVPVDLTRPAQQCRCGGRSYRSIHVKLALFPHLVSTPMSLVKRKVKLEVIELPGNGRRRVFVTAKRRAVSYNVDSSPRGRKEHVLSALR